MSETLINALRQPRCYPHQTAEIRLIESDLAWVFLTGSTAYKIKKPIDLYFLDASTLERRLELCQNEVRLNRRSFPELYLGVVSITDDPDGPRIQGSGPVIEYAVQMRQFDPDQSLDQILMRGQLDHQVLEHLIQTVFTLHDTAPVAGIELPFGEPNSLYTPAQLNFDQVRPHLTEYRDLAQLVQLEAWAHETLKRLWPRFAERKDLGMIRELHGDLHLGNAILTDDGEVRLFDCIEYRAEFRWVDVISEVAFLTLDFAARGALARARHVLNRYLELTGDYHALWVYQGYYAYRAMVRAKESLLGLNAPLLPGDETRTPLERYRRYTTMAEAATAITPRVLLITLGMSSTQRQQITHQWVDDFGLIRLRSDLERERLFGDREGREPQTYRQLLDLAELTLRAGFPVVVSGRFEDRRDRERFQRLAEAQGLLFGILTDEVSSKAADLTDSELHYTHIVDHTDHPEQLARQVRNLGRSFGMHWQGEQS
ncbi:MAG: phosphotransferase [Litorivicinaceae bacterium]|nr:phosphotransferase [Litorivicinaceae bacterium]